MADPPTLDSSHSNLGGSSRRCYNRDGSLITDIAYQPCIDWGEDEGNDSYCCGINHEGAGHTGVANDVCDSNGLCQNYEAKVGNEEPEMLWWRQGCTDPTWESPYCLKSVCDFELWQDENAPVRKCGNDSWCCGDADCCSMSSSVFALAATVGPTTMSPIQATATSTSESQGSTPTTSSPPPRPPASSGLSTGVKAGIGAGAAVGVLLLVVIALLVWKLKRKSKTGMGVGEVPTAGSNPGSDVKGGDGAVMYAQVAQAPPAELSTTEAGRAELQGSQAPAHELPTEYYGGPR